MFGEFLDYYESELKEKHEEEVEKLKEKYIAELREFAKEGNQHWCQVPLNFYKQTNTYLQIVNVVVE